MCYCPCQIEPRAEIIGKASAGPAYPRGPGNVGMHRRHGEAPACGRPAGASKAGSRRRGLATATQSAEEINYGPILLFPLVRYKEHLGAADVLAGRKGKVPDG